MAKGPEPIETPETGNVDLAAAWIESRQVGGAPHIGLDDGRALGTEQSLEAVARPGIPDRKYRARVHRNALQVVAGKLPVGTHRRLRRLAVTSQGAQEAHEPPLGTAHALAADDMPGRKRGAHDLVRAPCVSGEQGPPA